MNKHVIRVIVILNSFRCILHLVLFYTHKNRKIIQADVHHWLARIKVNYNLGFGFIYLLSFQQQYRNLFYHRLGHFKTFLNLLCPEMKTLLIETKSIGRNFYLEHGFATAIGAKAIGDNCCIYHNVTLGHYEEDAPIIGDNVTIRPGAIILGKINIGNNVVVGANTTVYKDVPDNCTVYSAPSKYMKWKEGSEQ